MMRVTDKVVYHQSIYDVSKIRSSLFTLQRQGATGKQFHSIEEDPTSAERIRMLQEAKEATLHYKDNITRSKTQLSAADSALDEATTIIIRAKELAVAAASDTVSAEQRTIIAQEVESLHESLVVAANTKAAGEYIFGGFLTDREPFQSDGAYVGDNGSKQVDVGPSFRLEVNVSGANAFTAAGGMDLFAELENLRAALAANNVAGIRTGIDNMDQGLTQISRARTDTGLKLNRLDVAGAVRDRLEDSITAETSQYIDIDSVEVFLELDATTSALQSAISVSQKVTNTSILGM
jgi:flagellar hook-associated protein 3 FlgL